MSAFYDVMPISDERHRWYEVTQIDDRGRPGRIIARTPPLLIGAAAAEDEWRLAHWEAVAMAAGLMAAELIRSEATDRMSQAVRGTERWR